MKVSDNLFPNFEFSRVHVNQGTQQANDGQKVELMEQGIPVKTKLIDEENQKVKQQKLLRRMSSNDDNKNCGSKQNDLNIKIS